MSRADRERWERRYAEPAAALTKGPHPLLTRWVPPAQPGQRALDLACGLGRDALWLAEQGYTVDALDISLTALRRARGEMLRRGLDNVNFIQADLDHFPLRRAAYDVTVVFRFLDRRLFPAIRASIRPGGLIVYQTFNTRQLALRPTFHEDHMLRLGELPGYFPGWHILTAADDGPESSLVAIKPGG